MEHRQIPGTPVFDGEAGQKGQISQGELTRDQRQTPPGRAGKVFEL
jgi:hypothetical protein